LQRALVGRERVLGPLDIETLRTTRDLGIGDLKMLDQDVLEVAVIWLHLAKDGFSTILGAEHGITMMAAYFLGLSYAELRSYSD
jgi:hypothetical protein